MKKHYLTIILILFLFISCNDNPTEINDDTFDVEIQVVNSNGNPLPNIFISIWDKINYSNTLKKIVTGNNIQAASSIVYTLPERCYVELKSYLLTGDLKENIVSGHYDAGTYRVTFNMYDAMGTEVYKVKMITSSDSLHKNILFQDSIYAVLWQPDPFVSSVGKTDNNGKVRINNKIFFPHLFNVPSIPHTSETGPDILSYLTLSDTVIITLSDKSFSKNISYEHEIRNGKNEIKLTWDESLSKYNEHKIHNKNKSYKSNVVKASIFIPLEWKLYQNYPNPFN